MPVITDKAAVQTETKQKPEPQWKPNEQQLARAKYVMKAYKEMDDKRKLTYPEFNDRTLVEFIDDSDKRLNAYVPSRESQGKEEWQSNYATRIYANKTKALLASTARTIPDMRFKAQNEEESFDYFSADVMKNLTRYSYNQGNPIEDLFFLGWSCVGHGTVLSYEGFERQSYIKKTIKSFDLRTGDVEFNEEETISEGEPISFEIPLNDLLIRNFYIRDIQDQPDIIWETYYADRERFESVWGHFPNASLVPDAADLTAKETNDTFFNETWKENTVDGRGWLVMRYMNLFKDIYRVIANGVELYNGPMLWADITRKGFGRKKYPIAKTIFEPFANGRFFYGNSMPNSAMGEGDTINTLYNSSLDKTYRSFVPPILVGQVNKDQLDLEDEVVAGDTKIYVEDINQVKQMEIKGISSSDVQMIDLVTTGINLTTLDPQQEGVAQKYVTARAAVAADERARQLKGVFFMFLESLWLQKVRLRVPNIILAYSRPRLSQVLGEESSGKLTEKMRSFNVEGTELSDKSKGTLSIEFVPENDFALKKDQLKERVEREEEKAFDSGKKMEKMIMPYGYFDALSFDLEIIPETLWQSSQSINMALLVEKINFARVAFPEYFAENKPVFFRDLIKGYGDDPEKYNVGKTMSFEQEQAMQLAQGKRTRGGPGARTQELGGGQPGIAELMEGG